MNDIFKTNEFSIQVISSGSFLDNDPSYLGKSYLVETATVRLNQAALNEWFDGQVSACREDYETEEEWRNYTARKEGRRKAFKAKAAEAVGFNPAEGSISVTRAVSEVFTIVHIHKVA